jgi:hypothetical protein
MKRVESGLCRLLGIAIVVTAFGLPGCSGEGATPAPEAKGTRDQVQKTRETSQVGDAPKVKKSGRR